MGDVVVFVDDAVRGTLPGVCAKDGVVTAAGIVGLIVQDGRLRGARVDVDLDASRRWVTLSRVHPAFVEACQVQEERQGLRA